MFPNTFSADVVGNVDTAGLCVDMIWGYVVNVEMRHAAAETVKKNPSVISVGGDMRKADCPKRKKEMEVMRIRSKRRLSHEEAARNEKIQEVKEN